MYRPSWNMCDCPSCHRYLYFCHLYNWYNYLLSADWMNAVDFSIKTSTSNQEVTLNLFTLDLLLMCMASLERFINVYFIF